MLPHPIRVHGELGRDVGFWLPHLAEEELNRPQWDPRTVNANQPWKVATPVTREETDRIFKEDRKRFPHQPIEQVAFTEDLVPGGFKTDGAALTHQRYVGNPQFALYSVGGEALEFTLLSGVIAANRNRPDAAYTITDAADKMPRADCRRMHRQYCYGPDFRTGETVFVL